jgi:hypothetical protein
MTKDDESLQNEVEHLRLKAKAKLANFLREEDLNDVWHCAESIELIYALEILKDELMQWCDDDTPKPRRVTHNT